ncbi:MAG: flagellar assembly protein FliH [Candidatus Saganbacteria bacterium]|uniref:Flagellar assembly protein FliH n=1 Tax=Candidatus Saganbacteria bacterium TaxID=2575572 RepID=A0A833NWM2_UNCSA|nr:MAG: flagellar assembly protein FliH [Candidatus Saganbacteria bacterium]
MGLIKHSRIQETGEILIETKPVNVVEKPRIIETILPEYEKPQAESEAFKIIDKARKEAIKILNDAKNEGEAKGKKEAEQKIKEALGTLNQAVIERKKIIKDAESEILRLALKVAEQVIRSEVSLHRDVCLNIVSEAINRVSDREQVIVKVNREDAEYIKKYKDRLSGILDGVKSFSVIEDSQIEPGGCVIETNLGYIDARISTKLKSIEEAIEKVKAE